MKAAQQPSMLSFHTKGQFLHQSCKFTQADNMDNILRKIVFTVFNWVIRQVKKPITIECTLLSLFYLFCTFIWKQKQAFKCMLLHSFSFSISTTGVGTPALQKEHLKYTQEAANIEMYDKNKFMNHHCSCSVVWQHLFSTLSQLLLSKCQLQTQCSFKNVITRFQTLLSCIFYCSI